MGSSGTPRHKAERRMTSLSKFDETTKRAWVKSANYAHAYSAHAYRAHGWHRCTSYLVRGSNNLLGEHSHSWIWRCTSRLQCTFPYQTESFITYLTYLDPCPRTMCLSLVANSLMLDGYLILSRWRPVWSLLAAFCRLSITLRGLRA